MHCFSDYESEQSDPTLLHNEMVEFARWLSKQRLIAEELSPYNVSDFSAIECAAAWEHIKAGRVTYRTDYGSDPYGIEEFVEFVGFKGSTELAEWLNEQESGGTNASAAKSDKQSARRTGRRKKTEKDSATLVIAALTGWHRYENGSVTNYESATNRGLAKKYDLAQNALSRFLKEQFPEEARPGKKYQVMCRTNKLHTWLATLNREAPDRLPGLQSHESGREDDE